MTIPAEVEQELRNIFDLCDENRTGLVSTAHFVQLGTEYSLPSKSSLKDMQQLIDILDPDKTGYICFEDFCRGVATILNYPKEFQDIDGVGDKVISENTYRSLYCSTGPGLTVDKLMPSSSAFNTTNGRSKPYFYVNDDLDGQPSGSSGSSPVSLDDSGINSTHPEGTLENLSDREENFECYGESNEMETDYSEPTKSRRGMDFVDRTGPSSLPPASNGNLNFNRRGSWLRTSLRKSPTSNKRCGSNALASQLYRSSSFNSSGRSSNCDVEDRYSDVSYDDDNFMDLNQKVHLLEQQVTVLQDNKSSDDDRVSKVRQENAALNARVQMLEEQLREGELRHENRLNEEHRRNKELIVRVEREKALEVENSIIRLQSAENEKKQIAEELARLKEVVEKLKREKTELVKTLSETESNLALETDEHRKLQDSVRKEKEETELLKCSNAQLVEELTKEIERLKAIESQQSIQLKQNEAQLPSKVNDLEIEIKSLREENKVLRESNEDLQAQVLANGVKEGRCLLANRESTSIAAEMEAMSMDEMKQKLKDQQEDNAKLKTYIDKMLLNIVERCPQLLEVTNVRDMP